MIRQALYMLFFVPYMVFNWVAYIFIFMAKPSESEARFKNMIVANWDLRYHICFISWTFFLLMLIR